MKPNEPKTWEDYFNHFLKLLQSVSHSYSPGDIFCDVCRIFSLSLRGAVTLNANEKEEIERQYKSFVEKYGKDGMEKVAILFAYTVEALEKRRQDFLGHVYEALNATKQKCFSQFFTPDSVSRMMARVTAGAMKPEPWKIVSISDPTCGAGALLIEGAEAFIDAGGRQGDLLIYDEDLDATACCIFYVQASLLGYAAVVHRMDSLAMKVYEGPWYTFGYFAHAMPMRLRGKNGESRKREEGEEAQEETGARVDAEEVREQGQRHEPEPDQPINIRQFVQGEFAL